MTADLELSLGTKEYVRPRVTCDVLLDDQVVEVRVDGETWLPAEWVGSPGLTRSARTTSIVEFTQRGLLRVQVRITDDPEIPIVEAGTISVY